MQAMIAKWTASPTAAQPAVAVGVSPNGPLAT